MAGQVTEHSKMVAVLSKFQWPSKRSGVLIAAAATGILVLWKRTLNEISKNRSVLSYRGLILQAGYVVVLKVCCIIVAQKIRD